MPGSFCNYFTQQAIFQLAAELQKVGTMKKVGPVNSKVFYLYNLGLENPSHTKNFSKVKFLFYAVF